MSIAFESVLTTRPALQQREAPKDAQNACLDLTVVSISVHSTLTFLRQAAMRAKRLSGCVTLSIPPVVADPLPLTRPLFVVDFIPVLLLGGSRRWWPTAEPRLANKLRRAGYEVIIRGNGVERCAA